MLLSANGVRHIALNYIRSSALKLNKQAQSEAVNEHFGAPPEVLAQEWEDLLEMEIADETLQLTVKEKSVDGFKSFLRAHYWLWARPRNARDFSSHFGEKKWRCERDQLWNWIKRIALLCDIVITWDERFDDPESELFIVSIDGLDMAAWEKKHGTFNIDKAMKSHKHPGCAFRYIIAAAIYRSRIVGIYGPYPGGKSEIEIFREHIKNKVKQGKFVVADKGNKESVWNASDKAMLAIPNPVDNQDLAKFKARTLARHETVNGRIKAYKSMANRWEHGMEKHGIAMRAVAATVQYKMDNGSELFPVFAEGLMNKANAAATNIVSL
jgi:hypothetical protein